MMEFVDSYTEAKMNEQEQECENIRESCYCDNNQQDDQSCEYSCYQNAGVADKCGEYEGGEEFEVQRYLECAGTFFAPPFRLRTQSLGVLDSNDSFQSLLL